MLRLDNLTKTYKQHEGELLALRGVSLEVPDGEIFGVIGLSGAGKSTLFRSIAGLVKLDSGEITVDGVNPDRLSNGELLKFRRSIGVVFQGCNLLMQQNVFNNVAFPMVIAGLDREYREQRAASLLKLVGLEQKAKEYPSRLSGGQQQRVAIARALALNPKILLLDEVTSALDPATTKQILRLLKDINREFGVTILLVTHEMSVVSRICDRVAVLNYGVVEELGTVSEVLNNPRREITKLLLGKESDDE